MYMLHTIQRTFQAGWRILRGKKTAADSASAPTDLTATGALSSSSYRCLIPETANTVVLSWTSNADGKTGTVNVYWRRRDGDWELLWVGDLTAGKQTTSTMYDGTTTGYFVDTLSETTDLAIGGVTLLDGGGADRVGKIFFSACGYFEIAVWYTTMSATTSWTCIMSEY
jgi:hypothetical protein